MNREQDIIQWATERGIFEKATKRSQFEKTLEEVEELGDAVFGDANQWADAKADFDWSAAAKDAIGDIIVTLAIQAKMWGLTLDECVEAAWNEIKDRKGSMQGGVFVKEAP